KRLETEIDNLPLDINYRDKIIADLNKRLYALYDDINEIETRINELNVRISSIELGRITYENVCKYLQDFNELFDVLTDEERKKIITSIIKEIHITNDPINNNFIKDVTLNFNISKSDSFDLVIPGEQLTPPKEIIQTFKENTYLEIQLENYTPKKRIRYKPTNTNKAKSKSKLKKVTYKVIQEYIEDKYNFKVHTAYIAHVKRTLGLSMYDAPNKVEVLKNRKHIPNDIQIDAIKNALTYYNIIKTQV
ncbi:MAG: hypothetical protein R3Y13_06085, partial [bacterium]